MDKHAINTHKHFYDISADNGASWTTQYLTARDVIDHLLRGYYVRKSIEKNRHIQIWNRRTKQ